MQAVRDFVSSIYALLIYPGDAAEPGPVSGSDARRDRSSLLALALEDVLQPPLRPTDQYRLHEQ
jgi:hypothetical protein